MGVIQIMRRLRGSEKSWLNFPPAAGADGYAVFEGFVWRVRKNRSRGRQDPERVAEYYNFLRPLARTATLVRLLLSLSAFRVYNIQLFDRHWLQTAAASGTNVLLCFHGISHCVYVKIIAHGLRSHIYKKGHSSFHSLR